LLGSCFFAHQFGFKFLDLASVLALRQQKCLELHPQVYFPETRKHESDALPSPEVPLPWQVHLDCFLDRQQHRGFLKLAAQPETLFFERLLEIWRFLELGVALKRYMAGFKLVACVRTVVKVDFEVVVCAFLPVNYDRTIQSPQVENARDHILPYVFVFRARVMMQSQHPQCLKLHYNIEL
jgi:hypothetical protein